MRIEIKSHDVERFQAALDKRKTLLRLRNNDIPGDYAEQLSEVNSIISEVVSGAVNGKNHDERYLELSWGIKR